jgi:hypothetical protein
VYFAETHLFHALGSIRSRLGLRGAFGSGVYSGSLPSGRSLGYPDPMGNWYSEESEPVAG